VPPVELFLDFVHHDATTSLARSDFTTHQTLLECCCPITSPLYIVNMVAAVHTKSEGLSSYLDIFSKEYRRAIIFCALVTLAPIAYGYDGTYFTALLETPTFGE
jgi:hypothetical protein